MATATDQLAWGTWMRLNFTTRGLSVGKTAELVTAALLVTACGSSGSSGASQGAGPIDLPAPHGATMTKPTGTVFTDGLEVLQLSGKGTAVIDSVDLVDGGGLALLGAKIAPPPRPLASTQVVWRWPPVQKGSFDPSTLVDAVGAEFGAPVGHQGWELLVGMRVTGDGWVHRSGIRVRYHVGASHYVATLPAELAICTTKSLEQGGVCPADPPATPDA